MLTDREFFEYFLNHGDELLLLEKSLRLKLRDDLLNTSLYDQLRIVNARRETYIQIYNDLCEFFGGPDEAVRQQLRSYGRR